MTAVLFGIGFLVVAFLGYVRVKSADGPAPRSDGKFRGDWGRAWNPARQKREGWLAITIGVIGLAVAVQSVATQFGCISL
jgi:hypothetical protein